MDKKLSMAVVGLIVMSIAIGAQAVLIAHYDGEGAGSPLVDQVGGQTAVAAGSGHQYGVTGPGTWGTAIGQTAQSAWTLSSADSTELNALLNDFSVAAWVYLDSAVMATKTGSNTKGNRIIGDDEAWNGNAWAFGYDSSKQQLLFTKNGVADAFDPTAGSLGLDGWHHVAVTVSSTAGIGFYVDGTLSGVSENTANVVNTGSDVFSVGRAFGSGEAQWFAGNLDEVRVYDSVIDTTELATISAIPEPASLGLLAAVGVAVLFIRRKLRG